MPQTIILVIGGTLGALATFLLQKQGLSIVVASCLVGLLGALLEYIFKIPRLSLVIFAGSFVGMTSPTIGTVPFIVIAGALCGLIYSLSLNIFVGFGGRLGAIAFISTIISFYAFLIVKRLITTNIKK